MNLWEEAENYTTKEVLEIIYDIAEDINKYGSKLTKEIMEYIREERINEGLCPDCGSELHYENHTINSHLAWGRTFDEKETISICECGWSSKNE